MYDGQWLIVIVALLDDGQTGAKDRAREDDDGFSEVKASVCVYPGINDNVWRLCQTQQLSVCSFLADQQLELQRWDGEDMCRWYSIRDDDHVQSESVYYALLDEASAMSTVQLQWLRTGVTKLRSV